MDFRQLDLNLLLVFEALYDERGVTLTAQRLKISQPTVSFSLNKLREFFKDELFVRHRGTMQPTAFAETLADPVRRIIDMIRSELMQEQTFDPAGTERVFSLTMSDIGELVFLPKLLKALRALAPRASIRCVSMRPGELKEAMANGLVDLALGYFPDLSDSAFYQQSLFDHPFSCIVRKDHPLIGDTLTLQLFLAAEHAVVVAEGRSQEIFERRMQDMGLQRRVLLRSPHFMSLPFQIANSDMISVVPRAVGQLAVRSANVKAFQPPLDIPAIELKQFWHRRVNNDLAVVWMRNLVAKLYLNRDPTSDLQSPVFGDASG
ncbi:LysR family transcriptional regulator [Rhizobium giardinii]|uniref:DNA-binding transcriptional LysR family regulator n=1 Tax=Rhizobium giardinii TaxID=56731 RepID=A0A7W8XBD7_9HYPH|nr:LysR family transcriptional regulator [Rhizobium giardinii]MBB5539149.1 DNA-binding transcriptional LysR family regulator [Rhizobium giardinii]